MRVPTRYRKLVGGGFRNLASKYNPADYFEYNFRKSVFLISNFANLSVREANSPNFAIFVNL